ncbi:site-specific integrase [Aeribacillus sp. FSL K6-1121]|uniref:site-specific integrase n=1 Tax=Aeribacillus sp. FSL K6-1121 TaxID=2954745 RepID=UPI0030F7A41D
MIKKYTLKNGEIRYEFQVYLGTDEATGKQMRTTRRGFKTKKEAELELARIKLQVASGEYRKERAETFKEVYELWLLQYENTVEQSTFVKTVSLFNNHILPSIGEYKIEKITVDICQKAVNDWAKKLKNISKVKAYASRVFNFAVKREFIQKNPFDLVELPRKRNKQLSDETDEKNFYTREQLIEFLSCLEKETNVKAYVLFRLLAFSGMRKGEALALTWRDINFKTNEIRINKALSRGKDNKLYIKSTKTNEARTIKMDEKTMNILRMWKKKQKEDNFKLGFNTSKPSQLVFSNEKNEFIQPTKTREWILYVQEKYNLKKVTTHGLRHTHCSLLFEAGATLKEVQDRLGHSDIKTTMNIYTHVTKKAQEQAIQKFSNYVNL